MFKFLYFASLLGLASATIATYDYPYTDSDDNAVGASTSFAMTDIIFEPTSKIRLGVTASACTYIGLFSGTVQSHTEQGTGGPITKVDCLADGAKDCDLNLYQNDDVTDPVPAGTYNIYCMNGNDLDHSGTAIIGNDIVVTINPYVLQWGSTLSQLSWANNEVERGDSLLVRYDGLVAGNTIEYRLTDSSCAIDYHTITAGEAGRGTISLRTAQGTHASQTLFNAYTFATIGVHTISVTTSAADYANDCNLGSLAVPTTRNFTVIESDTINVNGKSDNTPTDDIEAGASLTVNYNMGRAVTAGTYVGLWKSGTNPDSHVVDPDKVDDAKPLSVSFLPVGASGGGTIQLAIPITAILGQYVVMMFNNNEENAPFTPYAETSYGVRGKDSPFHNNTATITNTDVNIIEAPTGAPTGQPSGQPTGQPSFSPTSPTGEPTSIPTSSPSFVEEPWGEYVWTEKRHRKAGMCENQCSGHGTCEVNGNCKCFKGLDGEDEWTGPDCSSRTCPFDFAWVGASINSNNLHPWAECSNKGICDRSSGECQCFTGYEGAACQRTVCPDNCNDQGTCWPEKHLASKAGRVYDAPWDAMKHVGCLCDAGFRGPACDQQECPSGADPLSGYGNEAGRDCSGRGICDYSSGICACFTGFFGTRCQHQTTVM
jgi:hypothetical protein